MLENARGGIFPVGQSEPPLREFSIQKLSDLPLYHLEVLAVQDSSGAIPVGLLAKSSCGRCQFP